MKNEVNNCDNVGTREAQGRAGQARTNRHTRKNEVFQLIIDN